MTLPRNWQRLSTKVLEGLLEKLDDSTDEYEDVCYEIDMREAISGDDRIAEAYGVYKYEVAR